MKRNGDKVLFETGRILIGIVFIYKAIEFFACLETLDRAVPSFFGVPAYWTVILGIVWLAAGIGFLFNFLRQFMAIAVAAAIVFILISSTLRGFHEPHHISSTLLQITGWLCLAGSGLLVASASIDRSEDPDVDDGILIDNKGMFILGRVLIGTFFMVAGILHLANIDTDAAYFLTGFHSARFLVIFTGCCWIASAIALWFNLIVKVAIIGMITLIVLITILVNMRGINAETAWADITQLFTNVALIGSCLMLASKGYWWFKRPSKEADSNG